MDFNNKKRNLMVNSWFWTGLIDAEGSFSVIIDRSKTHKFLK